MIYIYIYMRSAKNYCFRMLSLLLTFRKGFRKPSGTFRNAGFEHLTYRLYLQDQFGDQISVLTSPTYIPHRIWACLGVGVVAMCDTGLLAQRAHQCHRGLDLSRARLTSLLKTSNAWFWAPPSRTTKEYKRDPWATNDM